MKPSWKSWLIIIIAVLGIFFVLDAKGYATATSNSQAEDKIDPVLLAKFGAESQADFFIVMTEKADLSPAKDLSTKEEKGQFVFNTLRETADRTQAELRAYLDSQGIKYRSFYIANKILVYAGSQSLAYAIADRSDVAKVLPNNTIQLERPIINPDAPNSPETIESNITFVNADDVWSLGFTGQGTVLAGNDTGLQWDHPAIIDHYRGWNGSTADHNYNWWDATGTYPTVPADGFGHGTHTTGTMVGDDGAGNQIGMAPGAKTIHCKNMTDGGSGSDATFEECFEWDLAPWDLSGSNPNPSLAPDAVNNSWGYSPGGVTTFVDEIAALQAAGILVEVSAGNEGPSCQTLRSPGDYAEVLTTGSVNHAGGSLPGTLTGFSSRGPSPLNSIETPDIMAPGENIRSSVPGSGYEGGWSGTSMAGPHVTGLIGLLWSANPGLRGMIEETTQIIIDTTIPLTGQSGSNCGGDYSVGPNNDWGYGTINAYDAVQTAILYGNPGTIAGTVVDSATSNPLEGVQVSADLGSGVVFQATTDANGEYTTIAFSGTYTVSFNLFGYYPASFPGIVVTEFQTTTVNADLDPAPSAVVEGVITDDEMGWPLYASITIGNGYDGGPVWTDPVSGYYSVTLPAGVYPFEVSSFVDGYSTQTSVVTVTSVLAPDAVTATYCSNTVVTIPDDTPAGVNNSQSLGDSGTLTDVNLLLNATHTYVGDLIVTLTHNDTATSVVVLSEPNNGTGACSGNNLSDIVLDDDGEGTPGTPVQTSCTSGTNPAPAYATNGFYTPNATLTAFDGQDLSGTWTVNVSDNAFLDTGTLNNWCLSTTVEATTQTANFSLAVDQNVCTAPGYSFQGGLAEDFETWPLTGWTVVNNVGGLAWDSNTAYGDDNYTDSNGGLAATVNSDANQGVPYDTELISPVFDLSAASNTSLTYLFNFQVFSGLEAMDVDITTDGGTTWTNLRHFVENHGTFYAAPGEEDLVDLSAYASETQVQIRWHYYTSETAPWDWYAQVDHVRLGIDCVAPASGGLVVGNVYDVNTSAPVNGAWVTNETGSVGYAMETPLDPAVDDAFYTVYSLGGSQVHTATYTLYGEDVQSVGVVDFDTVGQDFYLPSGFVIADPDNFDVTLEIGDSTTLPLTLTDIGGANVEFVIREAAGTNPFTPESPSAPHNPNGKLTGLSQFASGSVDKPTKPFVRPLAGGNILVDQLPNGVNGYFTDVSCDLCGGPQVLADNFVLTENHTVGIINIYSGYFPADVPLPDNITVIFHADGGGVPGATISSETAVPTERVQTGTILFGVHEYFSTFTLNNPVSLAAGTYWVEIYNDTGFATDDFFWETGNTDPIHGLPGGGVVALEAPGATWNPLGDELAFQLIEGGGDVPWVSESPITGTIPANGDFPVDVTFDAAQVPVPGQYTAFLKIGVDTPQLEVVIPLTLTVTCSTCGNVQGDITDEATTLPLISTIHITNTLGFDFTLEDLTSYDVQLLPGQYYINASATGYISETAVVNITTGNTTTQDFALWANTSILSFSPPSVEEFMAIGDVVTNTITITNSGAAPMDFEVNVGGYSGPLSINPISTRPISIPRSDGNFAHGDAAPSYLPAPKTDQPTSTGGLSQPLVLGSGAQAYGAEFFSLEFVGLTTDNPGSLTNIGPLNDTQFFAGDFIDGDFDTLYTLDYGFNALYAVDTATGVYVEIGPSVPNGAETWSGMSGDPTTGDMYAMSTDCNSNTLYTVDLGSGALSTIGSSSGYCIIDIAINSNGELYGMDILSDNLLSIDKASGAVTVIGSIGFDANYAQGMDFDEDSDTLYLAAFNLATFTGELRIADVTTGNTTMVGNIGTPSTELDAFAIATGGGGAGGWAYAVPDFGTVPPFSSTTFELVFDARSLYQVGDYYATLSFDGSFANDPATMPLTMHVSCPTCGFLAGDIYDAFTSAPVNADVFVSSEAGTAITLTGVASYSLALQPGSYDFLVTADGYFSETATVSVEEGQTVVTDFALTPIVAIMEYDPLSFEVTVGLGQVFTDALTINNIGTMAFDYELSDLETGSPLGLLAPISIPASDGNFPRGTSPTSMGPAPTTSRADVPHATLAQLLGSNAYSIDHANLFYTIFDTEVPEVLPNVGAMPPTGDFIGAGEYVNGLVYMIDTLNVMWEVDPATGDILNTYSATPPGGGETYSGMAFDPTSGVVYAESTNCSTATLYTIDPPTGEATLVGPVSNGGCLIGLAVDGNGDLWGYDIIADVLLWIDKSTGAGTVIGSIGFDANYGQGMGWDPATDTLYMAAFNGGTFQPELRAVDRTTGNTALIGVLGQTDPGGLSQLPWLGFEIAGGQDAPWLIELPAMGTVDAGNSESVEIIFDASVITQTGTYTAELRFDGTYDNSVSNATVVMHVIADAEAGVTVGDSTGSGEVGTTVTHTMWITNTGNVSDFFTLSVTGNTWNTEVSATTIVLDPGESAYVMCYVDVPVNAADGDTDTATVTVTSSFDGNVSDSATATTEATVPEPATYQLYLPKVAR